MTDLLSNSQVLPPEPFWKMKCWSTPRTSTLCVDISFPRLSKILRSSSLTARDPAEITKEVSLFLPPTSHQAYVQTKGEKATSKEEKTFILVNQDILFIVFYGYLALVCLNYSLTTVNNIYV